jgi:arsenical pump membrane protein
VGIAAGGGPVRAAVLIGLDVGPNLSVTGLLVIIRWRLTLRRGG